MLRTNSFKSFRINLSESAVIYCFDRCCSWAIKYETNFTKVVSFVKQIWYNYFIIKMVFQINLTLTFCQKIEAFCLITQLYNYIIWTFKIRTNSLNQFFNNMFLIFKNWILIKSISKNTVHYLCT